MSARTLFIAAFLLTAVARGLAADAQQAAKIPTIGYLSGGTRLELLREVVPRLSHVACLWNPDLRGSLLDYKETQAAARSHHVELQSIEIFRPEDLDGAFSAMTNQHAQAFIISPNPVACTIQGEIANLARKN